MVELFAKGDCRPTFKNITTELMKEINNFSDEKILGANFEEWIEYFIAKYQIETVDLYTDNMTQELSEVKIKRANSFRGYGDEPEYFLIDGYQIKYKIPFDGDELLLYLKPSSHFLKRFQVNDVIRPTKDQMGTIIFCLEFAKQELQEKENLKEFADSKFESEFKYYRETISRINAEAEQFNNSLRDIIQKALGDRKQKANDYVSLSEKLKIPLKINQNAPNTTPIALKRKERRLPTLPSQKPIAKEYEISETDYANIKSIINLACHSMEKTARTFIKLNEEEIRDIILSNLNTHYQGLATGETFNKIGKTDIRIQFENKAAYIGECKIWHGEKKFEEALEQLFSYTTWRDSKTSIIIFNKDNKDFNKVLAVINEFLYKTNLCIAKLQTNKNEWQCKFSKAKDTSEQISVHIVTYDLYVKV